MLPIIVALVAAEVVLLLWWVSGRHQPDPGAALPKLTPARLKRLDALGRRDGLADVPNNLTIHPFPTPEMSALFLEGEIVRSRLHAEHLRRTRSLRVRIEVTVESAEHLAKLAAEIGLDEATLAVRAQDASHAAKSAAAARSALETAEREHQALLDAVDADIEARVQRYWGANLRARNRSEPDLNTELDRQQPYKASTWRAWHTRPVHLVNDEDER